LQEKKQVGNHENKTENFISIIW